MNVIHGLKLRDAFVSGANNIANLKQSVDALNVFPVPDGDTGTNMSMTIGAAKREVARLADNTPVGEVAQTAASALLRGARGNSGVILSLLFRGFSKGLAGKETAGAKDLVEALSLGVEAAYKAVMKPTEGTILTVARLAAEHAAEVVTDETTVPEIWDEILSAGRIALENTPEQLPVLKKAGVVDAGGRGLIVIFEGMGQVFHGGEIIPLGEETVKKSVAEFEMPNERNAAGEYEGEITFTYCTEFIVLRADKEADPQPLRSYLESIGDSVVVVDDEDIIKCHVHTDNPGNALQKALEYGMLTNMKIENMREQHANQRAAVTPQASQENTFAYQPVDPSQEYGFVAVAAGEGLRQLFLDLGAENVVSGGQTMNPSTDDILSAIQATPAKNVFVLPNNKNIIMAAEQAAKLADRNVAVLPTRTIPQGLSAMLVFDAGTGVNENLLGMTKAFEKVGTGQVTFAARDSEYDGHKIKEGEILALENGKVSFVEKDISKAVVRLTRNLVRKDGDKENCFVTLIYGEEVTEEQAAQVEEALRAKLPEEIEIALVNGGQPVYYYIISVE